MAETGALMAQCNAAMSRRDWTAAVKFAQELVGREPETWGFHATLARAHFELGNAGETRRAAERTLALAPDEAMSHRVMGLAHWVGGTPWQVRKAFDRMLELAPQDLGHILTAANFAEACRNDRDLAPLLDRALALDPNSVRALVLFGGLRFRRGDMAGAQVTVRRALELSPEAADAHLLMAYIMTALKRGPDAMASVESALRVAPQHRAAQALHARLPRIFPELRPKGRFSAPDGLLRLEARLPAGVLLAAGVVFLALALAGFYLPFASLFQTFLSAMAAAYAFAALERKLRAAPIEASRVFLNPDY